MDFTQLRGIAASLFFLLIFPVWLQAESFGKTVQCDPL